MVGARLRRVVRGAGPIGVVLGEGVVGVERQVSVDLTRRDVVEPGHLGLTGGLEHGLGPDDVGPEEPAGVDHGQAVVGLGGEMDDRVDVVRPQGLEGELPVAHVAVDEGDPVLDVGQVGAVPGVGEGVVGHDVVVGVLLHPVTDEIGPDKACTAGDEHFHGGSIVDRTPPHPW